MLINVDNAVLKEVSSDLNSTGDVEPVAAALVGQHAAELPELRHLHPRPAQLRLHAADLRPGKLNPPHQVLKFTVKRVRGAILIQ